MNGQGKYKDLLYAYSLGCLDAEELDKLREYFGSESDFPWQELGEYQNLIALFPTILEIEEPGPQLKDKVARKLYRLRPEKKPPKEEEKPEEPKPDINQEIDETADTVNEPPSEITPAEETVETDPEPPEQEDSEINHSEFEEVKAKKPINNIFPEIRDIEISGQAAEPDNLSRQNKENIPESKELLSSHRDYIDKTVDGKYNSAGKRRTNPWIVITSVLFVVVAAGLFLLYMNISSEVKEYKRGIKNLNEKIQNLSSRINENRDLQKVLQTKDIEIINLKGTENSPESFGKLIIGTLNRNSILQLSNLPVLSGNEVYQLWMKNNNQYTPVGVFNPKKDIDYFHFTLPQLPVSNQAVFILTEESSEGAVKPGKIYLSSISK